MSSIFEEILSQFKSQVCQQIDHDKQPILRICINQECQYNQHKKVILCADCLIEHSDHYQDCIKVDKFIEQCIYNSHDSNSMNNSQQIDSIIVDISSQTKHFRAKLQEISNQYDHYIEKMFNDLIIDELLQFDSKNKSKKLQQQQISLNDILQIYKGSKSEKEVYNNNFLYRQVMNANEEILNNLLSEISEQTDIKLNSIKQLIYKYQNVEEAIDEEESQKNIIKQLLLSHDELLEQIKKAEIDRQQFQKELISIQNEYFQILEQEKIIQSKINLKQKLDEEAKRSFFQKIENLMDKQLNMKHQEYQQFQVDNDIFQVVLGQDTSSPLKNTNDDNSIVQDYSSKKDYSSLHKQDYFSQSKQNSSSQLNQDQAIIQIQNNNQNDIDKSSQQDKQVVQNELQQNDTEKEKYNYVEKARHQLQQKQVYYEELYEKEIQNMKNTLLDIQQKKELSSQLLEQTKSKYNNTNQNMKYLQKQLQQNEDIKLQEKIKMLELYKKSPIKRKNLKI